MKKATARNEGSMLIVAAIIMLMIVTFVGVSLGLSWQSNIDVQRTMAMEGGQAVGDAYLDWAFAYWRAICLSQPNVALGTSSFSVSSTTVPLPAFNSKALLATEGYTVSNYQIVAVNPELGVQSSTPIYAATQQSGGGYNWMYLAMVDVKVPTTQGGSVTAKVRRVFQKELQSPWDYAIFFTDMLEFHPSPAFTVNGPVHTNGALFASPDAGNSLTFGNTVGYGGKYFDGYAPGDYDYRWELAADGGNAEDIFKPNGGTIAAPSYASTPSGFAGVGAANTFTPGLPPSIQAVQNPFGISPTQFVLASVNPNDTGYREIIMAPTAGYADTFVAESDTTTSGATVVDPRYYNSAGVRVEIDVDNNVTVIGTDMIPVTMGTVTVKGVSTSVPVASAGVAATATDTELYNNIAAAITTNQEITDSREATSTEADAGLGTGIVRLATLNVGTLTTAVNGNNIPGWNGVIWISDTSYGYAAPTSTSTKTPVVTAAQVSANANVYERGIRVSNGATLPSGGLSVVSENPMYVQGNFNTGTWAPALIAGDAINVLSNNWVDSNSSNSTPPTASTTTINAAFLSGNTPTVTTLTVDKNYTAGTNLSGGVESYGVNALNYSGGVENFPRLHEDWTNQTLNYTGSMVEMFASAQGTGRWKSANYDPPTRNWSWDSRFLANPPPGTLLTTSYTKGQWFLK